MVVQSRLHPSVYEWHYVNQAGTGLPVFHGQEFQRGFGLAGIFSGLSKMVLPLLKSGAKALGKQALTTGTQFVGDVLEGKNAKEAAIQRSKEAGKTLLNSMMKTNIKRKRPVKTISSKKAKKRKVHRDIFS